MTLLNETEQQQVAEAIRNVEALTDAELVTVLASRADDYSYIPLLWAAMVSLILPGAVNYYPGWLDMHQLLFVQWSLFLVLAVVLRLPGLRTRIIPRGVRFWRAGNLARRQFLEQNLHHTRGGTGMLIFVSEAEHYVEILVDRGISAKISDATWQVIVDQFTARVREGRVLEGFLTCIASCGKQLETHLPLTVEKNELPNHLRVLEP